MNALRRYSMSKEEKRALQAEVARQARQISDRFALELDATILWALHEKFGFGPERLRRFYDCVYNNRETLLQRYDMHDDAEFILLHKLREIGADVRKWSEEQTEHVTFRVGGKP
ncbi:MAG: hypothetical protein J6L72_07125 [Butyricicoccus sp.]|nr:hypothetical protein [Butyricicoccus sp.]